jgi:hypothetical protein
MELLEKWEGVAFSCLAAALAGFLMTQPDVPPTGQWYVWGAFVVVCGLSIAPPVSLRARELLAVGLPPALCLLLILVVRGALSIIIGSTTAQVASLKLTPDQAIQLQNLRRLAAVYTIIFVGTVPAVIVSAFARGIIWRILKSIWGADPEKVSRLEKVINSILRIGALLGGGFVVGQF